MELLYAASSDLGSDSSATDSAPAAAAAPPAETQGSGAAADTHDASARDREFIPPPSGLPAKIGSM